MEESLQTRLEIIANTLEDLGLFHNASEVDSVISELSDNGGMVRIGDSGYGMIKEAQWKEWLTSLGRFLSLGVIGAVVGYFGWKWITKNWSKIIEFVKKYRNSGKGEPSTITEPSKIQEFVNDMKESVGPPDATVVEQAPSGGGESVSEEASGDGDAETLEASAIIAGDKEKRAGTVDQYGGILGDDVQKILKDAISNSSYIEIQYEKKNGEVGNYRVIPKEIGPHHKKPSQIVLWLEHDAHTNVHSFILSGIKSIKKIA